jgi:DNA polymerase III alpha subunit
MADRVAGHRAISSLEALSRPDEDLVVVGLRQTTQRFFAHEGEPFYILELEDLEGVLPVMMSPSFYRAHRRLVSSSMPFAVEGKMRFSPTTGEPVLQARRIYPV